MKIVLFHKITMLSNFFHGLCGSFKQYIDIDALGITPEMERLENEGDSDGDYWEEEILDYESDVEDSYSDDDRDQCEDGAQEFYV